jgi:hypothetical protein
MSGISSVATGGFTVSGFASNATYLGSLVPTYLNSNSGVASDWFNVGSMQDTYIFDVTKTGVYAGPQIITATGSTTDTWNLSVKFTTDTKNTLLGDYLFTGKSLSQAQYAAGDGGTGVNVNTSSFTALGTGATALASFFKSLTLHIAHGNVQVALTFTLADTTQNKNATWTEYFNACFTAGTRIATPTGERDVAALRIGDRVVTHTGAAKPVKWIGRRTYPAAQVAANPQLRPVLIRRDAIGAGMPHRDLTVSAMHCLYIDDLMIPAATLINGTSIARCDAPDPVTYFHIELADHDVIFAEGAPTETFIDDNSRLMFENACEYFDLYGGEPQQAAAMARLEEGVHLDAIRRRLAARAGAPVTAVRPADLLGHVETFERGLLRGWARDAGSAAPVELEVIADGETVARVIANRYRVDLDHAGIGDGIGGFTVVLPAAVTSLAQVSVRRVGDGAILPQPRVYACAE